MPCDTVQRSTVSLDMTADNKTFLIAALKAQKHIVIENAQGISFRTADYQVTGTFQNGKLTLNGRTEYVQRFDLNALKRAYSKEVVVATAKKHGWTLKQTKENKFSVIKRGF